MAWLQISGFGVRSQIQYYSNMDDYYLKAMNHYQEQSQHSKKMTAYERRKINSQKIAQVQFDYKSPKGYPESSSWNDKEQFKKEREWIKRKRQEMLEEEKHIKKTVKPVWTPLDQIKEEELWDE